MNDMKEICDRILDQPAPPLRDSGTVIAAARRSTARRARYAVAGSGLGAAAVVAAGMALASAGPVSLTASHPNTGAETAAVSGAAGNGTVRSLTLTAPSWQDAHAHGPEIAAKLVAAVPAGYTTHVVDSSTDSSPSATWRYEEPATATAAYISRTEVTVAAGNRRGLVYAVLSSQGGPTPEGDLCAASVTERLRALIEESVATCTVTTVNGVPIRVTTATDSETGDRIVATRFLETGVVSVVAEQGLRSYVPDGELPPDANPGPGNGTGASPMLTGTPLTAAQAAALAADPAMLP